MVYRPQELHGNRVANLATVENLLQVGDVSHRLITHCNQNITYHQARIVGRAAGRDASDKKPGFLFVCGFPRCFREFDWLHRNTDPAIADMPEFDDVGDDGVNLLRWNRHDPGVATEGTTTSHQARRIDPDRGAFDIDQGTAREAGQGSCLGMNEGRCLEPAEPDRADRRNRPKGGRWRREWTPDRQHEVADTGRTLTKGNRGGLEILDTKDCQVTTEIAADQGCFDWLTIAERDADMLLSLDDATGRDDKERIVRLPNSAGAGRRRRP